MARRKRRTGQAHAIAVSHDTTLVDVRCDHCGRIQRNQLHAGCMRCGHGYGTYAGKPASRP